MGASQTFGQRSSHGRCGFMTSSILHVGARVVGKCDVLGQVCIKYCSGNFVDIKHTPAFEVSWMVASCLVCADQGFIPCACPDIHRGSSWRVAAAQRRGGIVADWMFSSVPGSGCMHARSRYHRKYSWLRSRQPSVANQGTMLPGAEGQN